MRAILTLVALLSLGACDRPAIRDAKDAVRAQLKDPDSAQFRNVEICAGDIVWGQVNSRNGYGAYSGYSEFIAKGATAYIAESGDVAAVDGYTSLLNECTAQIKTSGPKPTSTAA